MKQRWILFTDKGAQIVKGEKPEGAIEVPQYLPLNIPMEFWKLQDGKIVEKSEEEKAKFKQATLNFSSPIYNPDAKSKDLEDKLKDLSSKTENLHSFYNNKSHKDTEKFEVIANRFLGIDEALNSSMEEIDIIYDNQTTLAGKLDSMEYRMDKYIQDLLSLKSELLTLEEDLDHLEIDGALKNEETVKQINELSEKLREHEIYTSERLLEIDKSNLELIEDLKKDTKEALKFVHETFSVPKIEHIHHINKFKYKEYLKIALTSSIVYCLLHLLMR